MFDVRRREFITLFGGAAAAGPLAAPLLLGGAIFTQAPLPALAQVSSRRPLIAVLVGASSTISSRYVSGFPQGMQEFGYVEGRDCDIVYRYADGDLARMPALADELIQLKPDVVVSSTTAGVLAVKHAAPMIPIVGAAMTDPVGFGLVASHARPGGQVTGILITLDTLPGKQLELIRELKPRATTIGVLGSISNPIAAVIRRNAEAAAMALGAKLVPVEISAPDHLESAFDRLLNEHVEIVLVLQEAMFLSERRRIATLATTARLPAMYSFREHVEDGGLMSYGTNLRESFRRAATYVDKILKGAKPGDLPVELPTRLELVVNLKAAKSIGPTIPETFLVRADEVIE
jgi:putative tryptophan/tyrosine transport system substrate-binding protein